jgi:hypothetical protein
MTDLSPAAQAVLDASMEHSGPAFDPVVRRIVAAALRAAADEVLPSPRLPFDSCCEIRSAGERAELLAIAAELKGQKLTDQLNSGEQCDEP